MRDGNLELIIQLLNMTDNGEASGTDDENLKEVLS